MTDQNVQPETPAPMVAGTANDQFKKSFSNKFWGSMIAATFVHFGVFGFSPDWAAEDVSINPDEIGIVDIAPPEVEIPPPPEAIARPATPVIAEAIIDTDITMEATTFESNPIENLPPPPDEVETDISAAPFFVPVTVQASHADQTEVIRLLQREYPPLLKDAGIGGTVVVDLFVDTLGTVQRVVLHESSGYSAFDEAALRVAPLFKFNPALNREDKVAVWVRVPLTFTVD